MVLTLGMLARGLKMWISEYGTLNLPLQSQESQEVLQPEVNGKINFVLN